jgi:hypothetical protein
MNKINIQANVIPMGQLGKVKGLILIDYSDTCNLCFKIVNAGEQAAWYGKGFGIRHYDCYIKRDTLLTDEEYKNISNW